MSNKDHPYPKVIDVLADCLDLQLIVDQYENENFDLSSHGSTAFSKLCRIAGISSDLMKSLQQQYNLFKFRVLGIIKDENSDIRVKYEHILFEVHQCDDSCNTRLKKGCALFNKLKQPLRLINMKVLHLFLKEESLYSGIELFLSIFVKCAVKTHAEGVAESMGNYIDIHSEKRRALDVKVVGQEAFIHWNGPPVHLADTIGENSLDSYFSGRSNWRFVTKTNKVESVVVSRMKAEKAKSVLFS